MLCIAADNVQRHSPFIRLTSVIDCKVVSLIPTGVGHCFGRFVYPLAPGHSAGVEFVHVLSRYVVRSFGYHEGVARKGNAVNEEAIENLSRNFVGGKPYGIAYAVEIALSFKVYVLASGYGAGSFGNAAHRGKIERAV